MGANKYAGAGSTVECDIDGLGTTWTLFGYTESITPPPRTRQKVDATNLDEDMVNLEPGIEEDSEFVFVQVWEPGDTNDEQIDTLFDSKFKPQWRITYPTDPTTPEQDTFSGWVSGIAPDTIDVGTRIGRTVTVTRTGPIVRAPLTP